MGRQSPALYSFNRGVVSELALARTDIERVRLSGETQTNWMPRVFGSAMLRPGWQYLTSLSDASYLLPFIFSTDDTALIQFKDSAMEIFVNDSKIQRNSVSTSITNGTFTTDLTGWTDNDEGTAASTWETGSYMGLLGTGTDTAIRTQQVTVAAPDQNVEHGIRVVVDRGPVTLRIGSSSGDDDLLSATLGTGTHSLGVTPTGASMWIEFSSFDGYLKRVTSIAVEASGDVSVTAPYAEADLSMIRWAQSADVVYLACDGYSQYKIERRSTTSWSMVEYEPLNGPWRDEYTGPITLSFSALSGEVTATASKNLFKAGHVGALFRVESVGQKVEVSVSAENTFSDEIRVTGVENTRRFTVTRAGTWSGTVTLQRSIVEPGTWVDVQTYTANGSVTYDDGLDNQIAYYRIGIKTGDYTSGTADLTLEYSGGSITGVVKVRVVTNETTATVSVIDNLGGTDASSRWTEGAWSTYRGFPAAVALYEGRLWWAGKNKYWGSVSDAYENYDDEVEGDSGPISRSIGEGAVDVIHWLLPLQRLLAGTASAVKGARSSSFDEPLTPSQFSLKNVTTQGSANKRAEVIDTSGVYVERSGQRIYELSYDADQFDYASGDLTAIVPKICSPGISNLAVQRQPDTRIHCVLTDGTVGMMVYDKVEQVMCWIKIVTDGQVEQCVVLPGTEEDDVYYIVNRDTGRFLEKWAMESECQGGTVNKCVDSHVVYSGTATTSITGLSHLEGESVVVWADGDSVDDTNGDPKTFTVSSGAITLDTAASDVVVGLAYTADFKSTKLAFAHQEPFGLDKMIHQIGLVLGPTHRQGLKYGPDFTLLDPMPVIEEGASVTSDYQAYEQNFFPFNGSWDTDSRLCLRAQSPRHCTLMAALIDIEVNK